LFLLYLFLSSAPYVKVYLLNNGAYVAKKKTKIARKTLDPLYQQALQFEESPQGKVLQVRVKALFHEESSIRF
jgi:flagellar motor protein MotB